jgi:predicted dehydrogenase
MADELRAPAAPVSVLLAAIGGYGYYYLQALLDEVPEGWARLTGVVDPEARASTAWPRVAALGVPVAESMDAFFEAGHRADLAVIVSPIHHHVPQSVAALARGCHVLCDKPLGATVAGAVALAEARDRAVRFVMIGYQWSFSAAIQAAKHDLLAGRFGRPRRLAALCAWPRDLAYYQRNSWAGRLRDSLTGAAVLDSPANNAMAHFLHNACFLLGPETHLSAMPVRVTAEMARAFPIDSADTTACRAVTGSGCEVLFLASHATEKAVEPRFRLECERGTIVFGETNRHVIGTPSGGETVDYGDPDATHQFHKLFTAIDRVGRAGPVVCGVEAAAAQTVYVEAIHESAPEIAPFPLSLLRHLPEGRVFAAGAGEDLERCYRSWALPSELGCAWAVPGRPVEPRVPPRLSGSGPAMTPDAGGRP